MENLPNYIVVRQQAGPLVKAYATARAGFVAWNRGATPGEVRKRCGPALARTSLNNLDAILLSLWDHPASRLIGVFDEAGNVDLDRVYAYVKIEAEKAPVTFSVPFLGPVTLKAQDVEKLYTCIVQA